MVLLLQASLFPDNAGMASESCDNAGYAEKQTCPTACDFLQCYQVKKGEVETMAFNNYLGKIISLCLSQCEMCLHCVVLL